MSPGRTCAQRSLSAPGSVAATQETNTGQPQLRCVPPPDPPCAQGLRSRRGARLPCGLTRVPFLAVPARRVGGAQHLEAARLDVELLVVVGQVVGLLGV